MALQCQMCGTYFKKNWRITDHLQKKNDNSLWFPVKDINISDMFYQIQNFLRACWASIITTNGINFLMAGPFVLYDNPSLKKVFKFVYFFF